MVIVVIPPLFCVQNKKKQKRACRHRMDPLGMTGGPPGCCCTASVSASDLHPTHACLCYRGLFSKFFVRYPNHPRHTPRLVAIQPPPPPYLSYRRPDPEPMPRGAKSESPRASNPHRPPHPRAHVTRTHCTWTGRPMITWPDLFVN